ncbi:hypothetical protein ACO0R3_002250 [Hanseniaspora guilliermondii]
MSLNTKTHQLRTVPIAGATILLALTGLYFSDDYYKQSMFYKTSLNTEKIITQKIDESHIRQQDIINQSYNNNKNNLVNEGFKATFIDTWNFNVEGLTKTLIHWTS